MDSSAAEVTISEDGQKPSESTPPDGDKMLDSARSAHSEPPLPLPNTGHHTIVELSELVAETVIVVADMVESLVEGEKCDDEQKSGEDVTG